MLVRGTFQSANTISNFMQGKSSTNYDYQYYDNLLIKWDSQLDVANMIDKTVDMGTIKKKFSKFNSL